MTEIKSIASVLLIDDNLEALQALTALINAMGVTRVESAQSAEEALEILQNHSFSLIVSDYHMEGMDGVAFLEKIRSQGDQTPIVLLSGAPDKLGVLAIHNSVQEANELFMSFCTELPKLARDAARRSTRRIELNGRGTNGRSGANRATKKH